LEAADGEADQEARAKDVLDLSSPVLRMDDDLDRLVTLLRVEVADFGGGVDLFAQCAQLRRPALRIGIGGAGTIVDLGRRAAGGGGCGGAAGWRGAVGVA